MIRLYNITKPTCSLAISEHDGYPFQYSDAVQMDGYGDHEMQDDYGNGIAYDSMGRGFTQERY